jgi:beta-lactam-binding protein with PASTA domain
MKSVSRVVLVVAMVGGLLSAAVGAGAQEAGSSAYLANVNGSSTNPVDVAVGTESVASGLAYGAASPVPYIPVGQSEVTFTADGAIVANVPINSAQVPAQTVVSGYGDTGGSAYPVEVGPIDAGSAKLRVWNATGAPVVVSIGSLVVDQTLQPGEGTPLQTLAADSNVPVVVDGLEKDVVTPEDSYTDAFAVSDGASPDIAISTIPSMTDLIAAIAPPAPDTVPVPDVAGLPAADGQAAIEAVGLVAATEEQPSADIEVGLVIETSPAAGTQVDPGSTVTMIVSTGPSTIPVPDVVGQAAADAQAALEAEGFVVTTTEESSAEVEEGLVISTNPTAGTEVAPGTTVDMAVSTGPEDVEVPEFIGLTIDEATALAEEVGLTITFVEDPDAPDSDGIVVDQTPEPGEMAEFGSEVVAQLSPLIREAYVVVNVDTNRLMTTTGLNFLPGSTTDLRVIETGLTAALPVDDNGVWWQSFALGDRQTEVETLLVEGTAADGSDYSAEFLIPPAGGSTDAAAPDDTDSGLPWWGWVLIGLGIVGIGVLIWWLVAGRNQTTTTDGSTDQTQPLPPPPAAPPADGS